MPPFQGGVWCDASAPWALPKAILFDPFGVEKRHHEAGLPYPSRRMSRSEAGGAAAHNRQRVATLTRRPWTANGRNASFPAAWHARTIFRATAPLTNAVPSIVYDCSQDAGPKFTGGLGGDFVNLSSMP